MPNPKGNPEYKLKYGEKTRVVRLPESIADAVTALLNSGADPLTVLQTLESQPIVKTSKLPAIAAVYFVATEKQLLYIGQTKNLKERFISHNRKKQFMATPGIKIFWFPMDSEHTPVVESSLIEFLEPELNGESVPEEFGYQTKHYGFRFPDDLAEKLNNYARRHKISRSDALMQLLASAFENNPIDPIEPIQQTEQIQELIDQKTAYLANATNEVKQLLESQIKELQNKLNQHEQWINKADEVNQERNNLAQENWLLKAQLNNANKAKEDIAGVKHTLETELETLKAKIEGLETRLEGVLKARDNQPSPEVRSHLEEVTPTEQQGQVKRDRTKTSKFKQELDSLTPAVTIPKATINDNPSPKVKPTATAKVSQGGDLYVCPKCGVTGSKGIDFVRDTQSTARNLKLKCIHCRKSRVSSAFKPGW